MPPLWEPLGRASPHTGHPGVPCQNFPGGGPARCGFWGALWQAP